MANETLRPVSFLRREDWTDDDKEPPSQDFADATCGCCSGGRAFGSGGVETGLGSVAELRTGRELPGWDQPLLVATGAKNLARLPLQSNKSWTFTTEAN